ncbi:MAG: SPFH domain-containing protein [Aestuariivita sp.]|nr:SPFH domain-containing protein [Aestuariivita sp.]
MEWVILLLLLAIGSLALIWFLQRYYAKASLDTALVRTGLGGCRVVMDGGCICLPIVHHIQKVSMSTLAIRINRDGRNAILTRDQIRADVDFEFELRVQPTEEGISIAAQTLGHRIARGTNGVETALGGVLIDAIQGVAATQTLQEIHLDRTGFTTHVSETIETRAAQLGLTLISTSLVAFDQSDLSQWNEENAFNAQGMRQLAALVAQERKERVRIETEAEVAVQQSRLTQNQRQLDLQRILREAEIAQTEHLSKLEADAKSREEQAQESAKLESKKAQIVGDQRAKEAQIETDKAVRKAELSAIRVLEEEKIDNEIRLSNKRAEEAEVNVAKEEARAKVILAAENVQSQKARAIADREHEIAQLNQMKELELEGAKVKRDVETLIEKAKAEAAVTTRAGEAERLRMEAEAAGQAALNKAENTLSNAVIRMRIEERKLEKLPEIMTQMMKPVEKIDSIKINQIAGATGTGVTATNGQGIDSAFGAAMDQILSMAVRLPAMKQMGEEVGLDFDPNLAGRTADYANRITVTSAKDKPTKKT